MRGQGTSLRIGEDSAFEVEELLAGDELGVEDQGRLNTSLDLLPEGEEAERLIIRLLPLDVRLGVANEPGCGILAEQG